MQPPGLVQEQAAVGRDGLVLAEEVLERRDVGAVGMAALLRLLELLRVAEQDQALRRLRDREHVRQRHLPGLVDEQHVHGFAQLFARPQPAGAGDDIGPAASEARRPRRGCRSSPRCRRCGGVRPFAHLLQAADVCARSSAISDTFSSRLRITLWLSAVMPTLAGADQRGDHVRAGVRLAGAGRTLDRQDAVVELGTPSAARRRAAVSSRRRGSTAGPRRPAQQQVPGRAVRPAASIPFSATHWPSRRSARV